MQRLDRTIEVGLEHVTRRVVGEPLAYGAPWGSPQPRQGSGPCGTRSLIENHQEVVRREQLFASGVQVCGTAREGLVCDGARAGRRNERVHVLLDDVLVDAAALIQQPEGGLELVNRGSPLVVRQALGVLTSEAVHHADVPALRHERRVVHESPERDHAS